MIVIKGMDRPANCEECKLKYMGVCVPNTGRKFDKGNDGEWCPIVGEIPEKHGRLIDADGFTRVLRVVSESYTGDDAKSKLGKAVTEHTILQIDIAPTVLRAEE